jgi:hypothetical protein
MEVTHGKAQNWCLDPFGHHEQRWFSQGMPTALVRDHGVEGRDPPTDSEIAHEYLLLAYVDPSAAEESGLGPWSHYRISRGTRGRKHVVGRQ